MQYRWIYGGVASRSGHDQPIPSISSKWATSSGAGSCPDQVPS